jgi:DNA-binding CsgD family transcriptional regulator
MPILIACTTATGGNPLLLVELTKALEAERVVPDAAHVGMVADVGPGAVSRAALVRLARLGEDALEVARAVSVLGEGASLSMIAAMAAVDERRTGSAVDALLRAEILRLEPELGFVHPLVAAAVYRDITPVQRAHEHKRAASLLVDAGAPADHVAAHLLAVSPGGEDWVVEVLVRAGADAMRAGAADSAVAYLKRAAAEPPGDGQRTQVLLELGHAELLMRGPDAAKHLMEAYELLEDPMERGSVAQALARALLLTRQLAAAGAIAARAAAETPPALSELRTELECVEAMAVFLSGRGIDKLARLQTLRAEPVGESAAAKMRATMVAREWTFAGGSSEDCARLASEALAGGQLVAADNGFSAIIAITTLARADRDDALDAWHASLGEAHRRGSLQAKCGISLGIGFTLYRRGELVEAEQWLRTAIDEYALWHSGPDPPMTHCISLLALVLLEQGERTAARAELRRCTDPGALTAFGHGLRRARRLHDARGPLREAIDLAERCGARRLVDYARSELHAAGGRSRSTMLGGVKALTVSERRVATLAAEGHTNREIAQALFITPKTVEMHLGNAYRKLAIGSRRELAGRLENG